jgi:hypothetical protein
MREYYPTNDKDKIAFWRHELLRAHALQAPYMKIGASIAKLYNGIADTERTREREAGDTDNTSRSKASLVFAWVDQSIANLLDRDPTFMVSPDTHPSTEGAPVVKSVVNYWYRETGQFEQDRRVLLDAFLLPYGVKKLGWNARLTEKPTLTLSDIAEAEYDDPAEENMFLSDGMPTRVTPDQDHEYHRTMHKSLLQDPTIPSEIKDALIKPHIDEHNMVENMGQPAAHTGIQYEAPFGKRWEPDDFLIDPDAKDGPVDARWVAFRFREPLFRWRANPNYISKALRGLKPNIKQEDIFSKEGIDVSNDASFDDYGLVQGWEIWARDFPVGKDKRRDMLVVIADDHDEVIRHDEEWPFDYIEDYPVELLQFQTNIKTWINKPTLALAGADNSQKLMDEFVDSMLSCYAQREDDHPV